MTEHANQNGHALCVNVGNPICAVNALFICRASGTRKEYPNKIRTWVSIRVHRVLKTVLFDQDRAGDGLRYGGVSHDAAAERLGGVGLGGLVANGSEDHLPGVGVEQRGCRGHEGPGHFRADAWPGDAGQGGGGSAPVHHLVRPAHLGGRLDEPSGGCLAVH